MSGRIGGPLLAAILFAGCGDGEAERRAASAETRARDAEAARAATERIQGAAARDLEARVDALRKSVADLEAAGRTREGELQAARADLERLRRVAEEETRRREAAEREAGRLREAKALPDPAPAPVPPPIEKPPAPTLGPTAVSDRQQVRKLTDGLNALLAGVEGGERWKIVSAGAAEDDRLVQVVLEARAADGTVSKSFQAAEGRFVLQAAAGTLSIKLKEGSVTYPGNRTVPFPGGAYTVLLVVDPAPFRASGNPLLSIL